MITKISPNKKINLHLPAVLATERRANSGGVSLTPLFFTKRADAVTTVCSKRWPKRNVNGDNKNKKEQLTKSSVLVPIPPHQCGRRHPLPSPPFVAIREKKNNN
jgi:hypothetical protein